jgi:hypothetical protein
MSGWSFWFLGADYDDGVWVALAFEKPRHVFHGQADGLGVAVYVIRGGFVSAGFDGAASEELNFSALRPCLGWLAQR